MDRHCHLIPESNPHSLLPIFVLMHDPFVYVIAKFVVMLDPSFCMITYSPSRPFCRDRHSENYLEKFSSRKGVVLWLMPYSSLPYNLSVTVDCYSHISCRITFMFVTDWTLLVYCSSYILTFLTNETFTDCLFEVTAIWPYHSLSADPFVSGDLMFDPFVFMIPVVAVETFLSRLWEQHTVYQRL